MKKAMFEKIFFILTLSVIFVIVGWAIYLFSQFKTGDFVYDSDTGRIGEVKGISFPFNYLVQWQDGKLDQISLFNLRHLSELNDFEANELLKDKKTPEIYFYPGGLKEESIEKIIRLDSISAEELIPNLTEKGNFVSIIGTSDCKPNFICNEWSECQAIYDLDMLLTEELVSGLQYRYCRDYSRCMSDFIDLKKCKIKINISTERVFIGDREYVEVYDEKENLISRVSKDEDERVDIQLLFDKSSYFPYCYDNIKNFDEDEIDCVNEERGSCPKCEQNFYGLKTGYYMRLGILIFLLILCLVFIILYVLLRRA